MLEIVPGFSGCLYYVLQILIMELLTGKLFFHLLLFIHTPLTGSDTQADHNDYGNIQATADQLQDAAIVMLTPKFRNFVPKKAIGINHIVFQ